MAEQFAIDADGHSIICTSKFAQEYREGKHREQVEAAKKVLKEAEYQRLNFGKLD